MQSASILCILFGAAALTSAAPTLNEKKSAVQECPGTGAYYVCAKNGFRGYCKSDPCDKSWCPDFSQGTCDPVSVSVSEPCTVTPTPTPTPAPNPPTSSECAGTGAYYVCGNNGFRGYCSSDPCNLNWCPDFDFKTCDKKTTTTPVVAERADDTVCAPGTGFFQSCSNGFRGCCKSDACSIGWCPDSSSPVVVVTTTTPPATVSTPAAAVVSPDNGVCPPGTGFFQVCSNGFRGCCQKDACTLGYWPAASS